MKNSLADFRQTLESIDPGLLRFETLETLQVNLGNRCNQACRHCHVEAGPDGDRMMARA